jgi:hypothetical protein
MITDSVDYGSGSIGIGHDTLKRFLDFAEVRGLPI